MLLRERFIRQGDFLFRWRSFVPLLLVPLLVLTITDHTLFSGDDGLDDWLEAGCLLVAFLGLGVRAYAIGHAAPRSSGGNTKRQIADDLNTTGLYSIVRHPLYVGNAMVWLGIVLFDHRLWAVAVVCLFFAIYYERIMAAEERFLEERFGDRFRAWAAATPAVVPNLRLWIPPDRRFDWRAVVRRDYGAMFSVVAIFTAIEVGGDLFIGGAADVDPTWIAFFLLGACLYMTAMFLKKRTRVLRPRAQS